MSAWEAKHKKDRETYPGMKMKTVRKRETEEVEERIWKAQICIETLIK